MKQSDERLIDLYPRHAGGRARRGGEHARRLSARPRRFLRPSRRTRAARSRNAGSDDIRALSRRGSSARGFSAASVARRLSAIRQLYRFLYAEGHRKDDPAAAIEGPKRGTPAAQGAVGRAMSISCSAPRAKAWTRRERPLAERLRAARLNCLLEVLYATGLRVSELVALPASAARRDERMLIVRGKGEQGAAGAAQRERASSAMREYLALREEAASRRRARKPRNGCFPRSARAAT